MSISIRLSHQSDDTFAKIVNYTYDPADLDRDIRRVIGEQSYRPCFSDMMIPYLNREAQHFQSAFGVNKKFDLTVAGLSVVCNDKMQSSPKKIRDFLSRHQIVSDREKSDFNTAINSEYFGSGFIHHYQGGQKDNLIYLYDMVEDPFYTLYTFAHELTHAMQDKNNFRPYGAKGDDFRTDYREIHANLTAGTFMIIKALQTRNSDIIQKTKEKLLAQSARMSNVMKTPKYGVRYFDWRGLNAIIRDIPNHYTEMITSAGNIDWAKLYTYTHEKLTEMDYTPDHIRNAKEFLQEKIAPLWTKGVKNPDFAEKIKPLFGQNAITDDFIDGFGYFMDHPVPPQKRIEQFYQQLAKPATRNTILNSPMNDTIPNIDVYRRLANDREKHLSAKQGRS